MSDETDEIVVREPWHETGKGTWSLTLSGGGLTVRVAQRKPGGSFQRILLVDGRQDWSSLRTTDKEEAEARARALMRQLLAPRTPAVKAFCTPAVAHTAVHSPAPAAAQLSRPVLPLGRLVTIYEEGNTFKKLDPKTQADYRSNARILIGSLGAERDVTTLCADDLAGHELRRRAGGIEYDAPRPGAPGLPVEPKKTEAVGSRAVGSDLTYLRTILNWAVKNTGPDGRYYLDTFPIRGMTIPKNKNPVRSWGDYDRFCRLLRAIQELAAAAEGGEIP
jgi:hypothetical protein